jgi:hypothetical protein
VTTIAAVVHAGRVYMGGDSCVTVEGTSLIGRASKVYRVGPAVVGECGGVPWCDALRTLKVPRAPTDVGRWISEDFCEALRTVWGDQVDADAGALVGLSGRLWMVEAPGNAWEIGTPYSAVGTGDVAALAVLRYTAPRALRKTLALTPQQRLRAALDAAEALTEGTRRPFKYVSEK